MKKILGIALMGIVAVNSMAATFLGWDCTDKAAMTAELAKADVPVAWKMTYKYNMLDKEFKTFTEYRTWFESEFKKFEPKADSVRIRSSAAALTYCKNIKTWDAEAAESIRDCQYYIHFARSGRTGKTQAENWKALTDCLIDHDCHYSNVKAALNGAYAFDARLNKQTKIDAYKLIWEKYYPNLGTEATLAADKKAWTPIITKLGLKLKALGVDVK